jgi:hypothetical protein
MGEGFLVVKRSAWLAVVGAGAALGCSSSSAVSVPFDFDSGYVAGTSTGAGGAGTGGAGGAGGTSDDGGQPDDGSAGDVVVPPGGSVGSTCSGSMPCRMGLACSGTNVCEPGGMLPPGTPCVINAECASGNVCNWIGGARVCGPGGTGTLGTTCQSNSDCANGFRCSLSGFGAKCTPEGTVDVNGACKTSAECFGGLACLVGKCTVTPPSIPPFGVPTWPGATCEADTGAAISYFRVPRGAGDKDFYRLPFPNDIRTKNGHPDLTGHPTPGPELLGFDAVDRYLRAIETDNDGFSPYSTVLFRFNTQFDLPDPKTTVGIDYVDVTAGPDFGTAAGNGGLWWLADYGRDAYICPNYLAVRTLDGYTLKSGHTYAVILHGMTVHGNGGPVAPDPEFSAMLAPTPPADTALTSAYAAYKPLRDYITAKSIDAATLVNAAVFTVGHPEKEIANIQQVVQGLPTPTATGWVKCGSGAASPCPDATGDRACPATADPAFDELHALISLPIFQSGTAPYLDFPDGNIDQAAPKVVRSENVCLSLTVPKGATMPANGWPVVVYAHGTGGSFRSAINEGVASALAKVAGDNTVPLAVLGIDQVEHGPRRGTSTESPDNLFYNFGNPHAARDNAMQGAVDQISLAKFAATLDITDTTLTGAAVKIDPAAVLFWGHSQGATEGGISTPYTSQLGGVVFSGQGASLIDALLNKTQPVNIAGAIAFALSDLLYADPTTHKLRGDIFHPVLSLLQTYLDPSDPLNHAAAMTPATTGGHHVFQAYGQNDSFAPGVTQLTYAIAANLGVAAHDPKITTLEFSCANCLPKFATETAGPLNKNVNGRLTAAVRQYAQPMGADGGVTADGHFVAYFNPLAQRDVYHFLDDLAKGTAPTVAPP